MAKKYVKPPKVKKEQAKKLVYKTPLHKTDKKEIIIQYYEGLAKQFAGEVEKISILEHKGEKGAELETLIKNILRGFLPARFSLGKGFVFDSEGNKSKQCDIIIYDNHQNPKILSLEQNGLFPVELVYGVVEVKGYFGKKEIKDSIDKIKSVKNLVSKSPKIAFLTVNEKNLVETKIFQSIRPAGFIWGITSSTDNLDTVRKNFSDSFKKVKQEETFDAAYVMSNAYLIWKILLENKIEFADGFFPKRQRKIKKNRIWFEEDPAISLLNFLILINEYLSIKQMTNFKLRENYLSKHFSSLRIFRKKLI